MSASSYFDPPLRVLHPQGDEESERALILDHLHLVGYALADIAPRLPRHVRHEELASAAMLGLVQAAKGFDEARGLRFDQYARIRIRGAVLDELRQLDWASRSVRALARRVRGATDNLTVRLGRAPDRAEIAATLDVAPEALEQLEVDLQRAAVLDLAPVVDAHGVAPAADARDVPHQALEAREELGYLRDAVEQLPERLRTIVEACFFEDRQLRELAEEFGVSESRVSQLRAEALVLLRNALWAQLDPELVPEEPLPDGLAARRRRAYYARVQAASGVYERLALADAS